jgi:hypothetical protein
MSEPKGRGAAWTEDLSEPKGRGSAWTEERRRSDKGRRRLKAPRRRGRQQSSACERLADVIRSMIMSSHAVT